MYLKTLALQQFRNISSLTLELNPEFNFIFGKNAQGKTSIVEAVYYLSTLKSFRTTARDELIRKGDAFAKISALFEKDDLNWEIDIHLAKAGRDVWLNKKKPQNRQQYHDLIPVVLFEPHDIYLFRDSPSVRRQYLNRAVFLQEPGFVTLLRDYEQVIAQKNKLLKERGSSELIQIWNDRLIEFGSELTRLRLDWFHAIQEVLATEYAVLSRSHEKLRLQYRPKQGWFDPENNPTQIELREALVEKILAMRQEESDRRESLVGPHRDDFQAFLGDRELGAFGSQGENRSVVIALKLAQLKLYAEKFKKTPLFLLDDVASELDESRCQYLFSYLKNESTQVFLTTTENRLQGPDFKGHSSSFLVENGTVSQLQL